MYKNKGSNGRNNIAGIKIKYYRELRPEKTSQNTLAKSMQLSGIDLDKNAVQRIESGQRFVTDIELKAFAKVLEVTYSELLD